MQKFDLMVIDQYAWTQAAVTALQIVYMHTYPYALVLSELFARVLSLDKGRN